MPSILGRELFQHILKLREKAMLNIAMVTNYFSLTVNVLINDSVQQKTPVTPAHDSRQSDPQFDRWKIFEIT